MEKTCDILIAGGGTGGVAAAIRAAAMGCSVALLDENRWLGGQITSQGVSALDEHALMESFGGTALYYEFRERVRQYYREHYRLSRRAAENFNPGSSDRQRRLAFEPAVGAQVIGDMLSPFIASGRIAVFRPAKVVEVFTDNGRMARATAKQLDTGGRIRICAAVFIDATELGDLLPLAGIPYTTGVESFAQTHEPSAPPEATALAAQAFGYTFALENAPGTVNTIVKPRLYEEMAKKHRFSLGGMKMFDRGAGAFSFWTYRRIIDAANFDDPAVRGDITLVNCTNTGYREDTLIDRPRAALDKHLYRAKQQALSYLYWLQTQAPRDDGGYGYPEFKLRPDLMGTRDGLSQYPYIRESRRVRSLYTIREQDLTAGCHHGQNRARLFHDSVGVGWYGSIDIHWCCHTKKRQGSGQRVLPFQIPMGALLTDAVHNFIAGAKNIGATHIANGVCRLHPVEWNIGESAGALAAHAVLTQKTPREIYHDRNLLRAFQLRLLAEGIPLSWFDDVPPHHEAFIPVQYLSLEGVILGEASHLHFHPDGPLNRAAADQWLYRAKLRFGPGTDAPAAFRESMVGDSRARSAGALFLHVRTLPAE